MQTNNFTADERFLLIQALNHRIINNYDEHQLFENKSRIKKFVIPVSQALNKLTQTDQKLNKNETTILLGCINEMIAISTIEERNILLDCRKKITTF